MKLLNYIYEFLLGEDTDVPFEDPYCLEESDTPPTLPTNVIAFSSQDVA